MTRDKKIRQFDPNFLRCGGPATLLLALGDDDDDFGVVWAIQQESCPEKVKVRAVEIKISGKERNPACF